MLGIDTPGQSKGLSKLALPLPEYGTALLPVVLLSRRELFVVIRLRLRCMERLRNCQHRLRNP